MEQPAATVTQPHPLDPASEKELVRRCQDGDMAAFDRLVGLWQDIVYGLAYRLMGDYDAANDLAQEVFLTCFRKIGQFRGESRLKTWLYRITVNLAKNAWKRTARRPEGMSTTLDPAADPDDPEAIRDLPDARPGPRQQAEARQAMDALWRQLARLNPEHREALTLRCMEDLSYEEIAGIMDCSLGTVKSRINRARNELRGHLKDYL